MTYFCGRCGDTGEILRPLSGDSDPCDCPAATGEPYPPSTDTGPARGESYSPSVTVQATDVAAFASEMVARMAEMRRMLPGSHERPADTTREDES